jgi:hypothetical protein
MLVGVCVGLKCEALTRKVTREDTLAIEQTIVTYLVPLHVAAQSCQMCV